MGLLWLNVTDKGNGEFYNDTDNIVAGQIKFLSLQNKFTLFIALIP